jgi:hypothetical protein
MQGERGAGGFGIFFPTFDAFVRFAKLRHCSPPVTEHRRSLPRRPLLARQVKNLTNFLGTGSATAFVTVVSDSGAPDFVVTGQTERELVPRKTEVGGALEHRFAVRVAAARPGIDGPGSFWIAIDGGLRDRMSPHPRRISRRVRGCSKSAVACAKETLAVSWVVDRGNT